MFAFAIWDESRKRLYLVRDRLGVKPLGYFSQLKEIAFASTIDALRTAGLTGQVNSEAVLEFAEYGFVTDASAIFEGVHKLPPATILEWQDGRFKQYCYWTLPVARQVGIGFEQAVEETERLLVDAVRMRLQSDAPLVALLSGGIDSALVCWAAAKLNANITAFTVTAPGDVDDEEQATRKTARLLGIDHQVVPLPEAIRL